MGGTLLSASGVTKVFEEGQRPRRWPRTPSTRRTATRRRAAPASRPTDARVLAAKVAFAEPLPLKLGTTVDLRIAPGER
jgi:hypothetical protein